MKRRDLLGCAVARFTCSVAKAQDFTAMEAALRAEANPGISVAITRGTEVIYQKAFGVASKETSSPVTAEMLFRLGSTTKMITAATLLSFVDEGKFDLQAPVSRYVNGLPACLGAVTAHQLLTHTAGIKDVAPMFGSHDDSALEANVRSWREDYCEGPAGKQFKYSNPSYVLAGYLSQVLSGKPFADTVAERILIPLGMTHSTFRPTMAMTYPLAEGHDKDGKIIRPAADYAGAWPAGSLFSNTGDLSRWVIAVLTKNFAPAISKPYVARTGGQGRQYGYGLDIRGEGKNRILEHAGDRDGYGSFIRMYPEQRVGIIMLGNWTSAKFPRSLKAAATALSLPE
jgi:CubicO group peptidase (beta-lactamase class C family)